MEAKGVAVLQRGVGDGASEGSSTAEAGFGTFLACGTARGTFLDMLITYFAIVLICFLLQFFHRGLRIGLL